MWDFVGCSRRSIRIPENFAEDNCAASGGKVRPIGRAALLSLIGRVPPEFRRWRVPGSVADSLRGLPIFPGSINLLAEDPIGGFAQRSCAEVWGRGRRALDIVMVEEDGTATGGCPGVDVAPAVSD